MRSASSIDSRTRVAFAAHVGDVDAAGLRGFPGKRDQLFRLRIRGRGVFERGRDTHSAVAHRIADQSLHLFQLLGGGLNVRVAEHHAPHLGRAHVTGEVDSHALLFQPRKKLPKRAPIRSDLVVLISGPVGRNDGIVQRRGRPTLAGDLGGDSLKDFRRQARVHKDRHLRLPEHVDKAGRDHLPARVNGALARGRAKVADGGDSAVADTDVSGIPRRTGPIDDVAAGDHQVEGRAGLRAGVEDEEQENVSSKMAALRISLTV